MKTEDGTKQYAPSASRADAAREAVSEMKARRTFSPNTVERTGRDSYRVTIWLRDDKEEIDGMATFECKEVERLRRSEFNVFLEASFAHGDQHKEWSQRINLASSSAREGVVRAFSRMFKGKEFDSVFSEAVRMLERYMDAEPRSVTIGQVEPLAEKKMLLAPFITAGSPNLIFGDGSSCKTYISIGMMVAVATGKRFLGFAPDHKAPVMILDYEDTGPKFFDRVNRVLSGVPDAPELADVEANIHYFKAAGVPVADMVPALKEEVSRHGIELLVIDSVAYACGAEIEKAEAVIRYFNALDAIGVATLGIAHVTKSSSEAEDRIKGQKHAIGSIFFNNAPRNIWNVQKQGDENDMEPVKNIALFNRKANDGPLHPMVPVQVDFSVPGATSIRSGNRDDWEDAKPLGERITSFLMRRGPAKRQDIERHLEGEKPEGVKTALRRLRSQGRIRLIGGDGGEYAMGSEEPGKV